MAQGVGQVVLALLSALLRGTSVVAWSGSKSCWLRLSHRSVNWDLSLGIVLLLIVELVIPRHR